MKNRARALTLIGILAGMVLLFQRCKYDVVPSVPSGPVSFHDNILPLFRSTCAISGCHDNVAPGGGLILLDSVAYVNLYRHHEVDTLNPQASVIYNRMNSVLTPMPPTGKTSSSNISMVLRWIVQGGRNN